MIGRLKFDLSALACEILDHLDPVVWTSSTTRFLDPAMGGGQFVSEIERRLLSAGHSRENVAGRVFGCETNVLRVNYARNRVGLIGHYEVCDALSRDWGVMKFDVIVGNPPYQGSNTIGTQQPKSHNLWSKFVSSSIDMIEEGGYVAMVTPDSWMSANSQVLNLFKQYSLTWCKTDVSEHFNVGSSFTAWILFKGKGPTLIDGIEVDITELEYLPRTFHQTWPIHSKVIKSDHSKILVKIDTTCHSDRKHNNLSEHADSTYVYKTFHTNAQTKWAKKKTQDYDKSKIVWTLSGYFKPFYSNGELGTTEVCQYILVDESKAANTLSWISSKLYQFIVATGKWSGFSNGRVVSLLPELDSNRMWADADIYAHFKLTPEEIALIESTVK